MHVSLSTHGSHGDAGRRATDVDVVVVGAGPTGLTMACELRLAGIRCLVLERRSHLDDTPKAAGFNGQILSLLRYRGVLERFEAACGHPSQPAPRAPFGGIQLDFTGTDVVNPPLRVLGLAQPRLERLLDEYARELGAVIRRGHAVVDVVQDATGVTAKVHGPDGAYRLTARYLVGCDGPRSAIREQAGIPFPGVTYPEVNRLGQAVVHESVTRHDNGDLEVAGLGRVAAGFTRTERGAFALGVLGSGQLMIQTTEEQPAGDEPITWQSFRTASNACSARSCSWER
jgi:2-polyprenyl-6-methoxyphenol hydroxylase-like FAD-dependent oxidoreductase